jgi:hypothetical protein
MDKIPNLTHLLDRLFGPVMDPPAPLKFSAISPAAIGSLL